MDPCIHLIEKLLICFVNRVESYYIDKQNAFDFGFYMTFGLRLSDFDFFSFFFEIIFIIIISTLLFLFLLLFIILMLQP